MRAWLVCAALFIACRPAERGRVAEVPPPPDERTLCDLLRGQLDGWRGLQRFDPARAPACLGTHADAGTVTLHGRQWRFQRFASPAAETWLYDDGRQVELVSVFPSSAPPAGPLEAELGGAPWRREVSFAERLERPALPPLTRYDGELVFADRGLALLTAAGSDGALVVHRLRGFAPTDARAYFRRFVQERPVQWQGP